MMLTEVTAMAEAALPVQKLKDHLRMGTGFGDEALEDGLMGSLLRAAIAVVEARIAKALLTRRFRLTLADWRDAEAQALPLGPVQQVHSVTLRDATGAATVVDPGRYVLVPDMQRPRLQAAGSLFPMVPTDGRVEIEFDAGFGAVWTDVPAALSQAVLLLAAEAHENRHAPQTGTGLPPAVLALLEPWRVIRRLGPGGRA